MTLSDEEYRARVDKNGVMNTGAIDCPARRKAWTVFAQQGDARIDAPRWQRQAEQFFRTKIGLVVEKRYRIDYPRTDAALFVVAPGHGAVGTMTIEPGRRLMFGRPREASDLEIAEIADTRAGSPGMAQLARRCDYVWLIETEGSHDVLSPLLSAIVASVVLGPILSPDEKEIFGVKTARAKLESLAEPPYR